MERLLDGRAGRRRRPAAAARRAPLDPLLERVVTHLVGAMGRAFARADPEEPIALARLACAVGDDAECAPVFAAVLELLDLYEEHSTSRRPTAGRSRRAGRFVVTALAVARTPDVPLPERPGRAAADARRGRARRRRLALAAAADRSPPPPPAPVSGGRVQSE